jgi:hypothetical protein
MNHHLLASQDVDVRSTLPKYQFLPPNPDSNLIKNKERKIMFKFTLKSERNER